MHWTDLTALVDHVERELAADLRLGVVAERSGYSPYHLHRSFRRAFGLTPLEYVRRRRLTEAARALSSTCEPVAQIAARHGFGSQQSFTAVFAAAYGAPPSAWRAARRFSPLLLPYRFPESQWRALDTRNDARIAHQAGVDDLLPLSLAAVDMLPGLDPEQHVAGLADDIASSHVFLAHHDGRGAAALVVDPASGHVPDLAVHPLARRTPVLRQLTAAAQATYPLLTVATFRAGDRADLGHRRALLDDAFRPVSPVIECGYPALLLERGSAGASR